MIALPSAEYASAVAATEFRWLARMLRTVVFVLIGVISTVVVAVASPQAGDALSVAASELVAVAGGHVGTDAHLALVYRGQAAGATADGGVVRTRVTGVGATTVVHAADVQGAVLSRLRIHLKQEYL